MRPSPPALTFRRAQPADAPLLTEAAVQAKQYWGYAPEWMAAWAARLVITSDYLQRHFVCVAALTEGAFVGWYALLLEAHPAVLDHLWVLPAHIGRGCGRALFEHAVGVTKQSGARQLELEAEPNALGFYEHLGLRFQREVISEMGRSLPVLTLDLTD